MANGRIGSTMTTTLLSSIAGSLLSLLFSYLPGLSDWYAQLGVNPDDGGTRKRLLMLALLCLTALASFGLACSGWGSAFGMALNCERIMERRGIFSIIV